MKSKADQLDLDKLAPVPVDLTTLTDLIKNDVINEVKKETLSITKLATTTALNAKTNVVETKIPNITNLATTAAVIAVKTNT